MPLLPNILQRGILKLIEKNPDNPRDAADKFAEIYHDYSKGALALGTPASFTGTEKKVLADILYLSFIKPETGTPDRAVNAMVLGITSYWLNPPVVFGYGPVAGFPGAPVLQAGLVSFFTSNNNPKGLVAAKMASVIDVATRTVFATGLLGPQPLV